jgi:hypothetical protein
MPENVRLVQEIRQSIGGHHPADFDMREYVGSHGSMAAA